MKLLNLAMRFFEVEMLVADRLPKDLANLVMDFLRYPVEPWDAYDMWVPCPEYDSNGNYGSYPSCPIELPGLTNAYW